MRRHYQYLDLDFMPLVDMKALSVFSRITLIPGQNINPDLINYLEKHELQIDHAAIFYAHPGFNRGIIHVDGEKFDLEGEWPSRCKLNYVVGETSTVTMWYDISLENRIKTKCSQTAVLSKFYGFDRSVCVEVDRATLGPWHLFESGVPHTVQNSANKPRWCISFSLRKKEHPGWLTFDEVSRRLTSPSFNG